MNAALVGLRFGTPGNGQYPIFRQFKTGCWGRVSLMCAACVGLTSNMQLYAASDSRSADSDDLLQMSVQERDVIGHGLLYDTVLASIRGSWVSVQ